MPRIRLPANGWKPRPHQQRLWDYLETGGKRAIAVWHRRAGKDEICLHRAAVAAFERPATYWHMLPEYSQGRKAIWTALNPHTGRRRIDEAFPHEARENTNEQEMFIRFKSGATWQVVGSDCYDATVGSPPAGVTFSEWALSNPAAWAYLAPILIENNGWSAFITTPRGRNHALSMLKMARNDPKWFAEILTVDDTRAISHEIIEAQRKEYHGLYGIDAGDALIQQEYYCDFNAPILGAYYGKEFARVDKEHRIGAVPFDPAVPVHTAWDLGYRDDTAIWWYQVLRGEIHVIDHHASSGLPVEHYLQVVRSKPYRYGQHWLPHDARAKTLASGGKSIEEMVANGLGIGSIRIVPGLDVQDGIQAARVALGRCWFDEQACAEGLEALRQYQREWDEDKKAFRERPRHDWTSHSADAFRMLAVAWRAERAPEPKAKQIDYARPALQQHTYAELEAWSDSHVQDKRI